MNEKAKTGAACCLTAFTMFILFSACVAVMDDDPTPAPKVTQTTQGSTPDVDKAKPNKTKKPKTPAPKPSKTGEDHDWDSTDGGTSDNNGNSGGVNMPGRWW